VNGVLFRKRRTPWDDQRHHWRKLSLSTTVTVKILQKSLILPRQRGETGDPPFYHHTPERKVILLVPLMMRRDVSFFFHTCARCLLDDSKCRTWVLPLLPPPVDQDQPCWTNSRRDREEAKRETGDREEAREKRGKERERDLILERSGEERREIWFWRKWRGEEKRR
jgi:hypothetical protein